MNFFRTSTYTLTAVNETNHTALITCLMTQAHTPRKHAILIEPKANGVVQQLKRQRTVFLVNCGPLAVAVEFDKADFSTSHQVVIKDGEVHFDDATYTPVNFPISAKDKEICEKLPLDNERFIGVNGRKRSESTSSAVQVRCTSQSVQATLADPGNLLNSVEQMCLGSQEDENGFALVSRIPSYTIVKHSLIKQYGVDAFNDNKDNVRLLLEKVHVTKLPRTSEIIRIKSHLPDKATSVVPPPSIQILTATQIDMLFAIDFDKERAVLKENKEKNEANERQQNVVKNQQRQAELLNAQKLKKEQEQKQAQATRDRQAQVVRERREQEQQRIQQMADEAQQRARANLNNNSNRHTSSVDDDLGSLSSWISNGSNSSSNNNNNNNNNNNSNSNSNNSNSMDQPFQTEVNQLDIRMKAMGYNVPRDQLLSVLQTTNGDVRQAIQALI